MARPCGVFLCWSESPLAHPTAFSRQGANLTLMVPPGLTSHGSHKTSPGQGSRCPPVEYFLPSPTVAPSLALEKVLVGLSLASHLCQGDPGSSEFLLLRI